jgi:hypothetical protein
LVPLVQLALETAMRWENVILRHKPFCGKKFKQCRGKLA